MKQSLFLSHITLTTKSESPQIDNQKSARNYNEQNTANTRTGTKILSSVIRQICRNANAHDTIARNRPSSLRRQRK